MFHWNEGIIAYSDAWMYNNKSSKFVKPCEVHFAKSLVLASGRDESEYTQLITAIENEDKYYTEKLLEDHHIIMILRVVLKPNYENTYRSQI